MISDVTHLPVDLLAICTSSLEKYLFRSSAHVLNMIMFAILSRMGYLYIMNINLFLVYDLQIFPPFCPLWFHFADCCFRCAEAFQCDEVPLVNFTVPFIVVQGEGY